ncbi:hypothetical protein [Candidatus Parabeggiatoa sp. HSG14]|uniref:hypothetical protein n=1 Tax=Candidatus Parabeggiatoa sp. HSG14 TaxID=3055593 RepID=UPI0025A82032|nr:hypothetical protein [Thiotrichales bacterium HSG14]
MFFRTLIVCMLLYTYSVQANEIAEKEEVAETDSKVVEDNSEIVINCKTFMTLQQVLVNAKSSADSMVALISFFKTQTQLNTEKLAEAKTKEEFDEYRQIIRSYQEKIITLEKQQAELEESVTFIGQKLETIREHLPSCEEEHQTE